MAIPLVQYKATRLPAGHDRSVSGAIVAPRALCLTESGPLADSLTDLLEGEGISAESVATAWTMPGLCQHPSSWEIVAVDANLPGLSRESLLDLKGRAPNLYLVLLAGWWDVREHQFSESVNFVLNVPCRRWQVREMLAQITPA